MLCGFNVVTKQIDLPVAFNQLINYTIIIPMAYGHISLFNVMWI